VPSGVSRALAEKLSALADRVITRSRRTIRLGDGELSVGKASWLLGVLLTSLAAWWVLIMVAVAVVRRLWGT
jgi:hypothetical protein